MTHTTQAACPVCQREFAISALVLEGAEPVFDFTDLERHLDIHVSETPAIVALISGAAQLDDDGVMVTLIGDGTVGLWAMEDGDARALVEALTRALNRD